MKKNSLIVEMDLSDWADEALTAEIMPKTLDDLVTLVVQENIPTAQAWRFYVVSREKGLADADAFPPNKEVFQYGGTQQINLAFRALKKTIELGNGRTFKVRELVAPVFEDEEEEEPEDDGATFEATAKMDNGDGKTSQIWQRVGTDGALGNAIDYFHRCIPGHIWGRLAVIAACEGDVRGEANWLQDKIEEMVDVLT